MSNSARMKQDDDAFSLLDESAIMAAKLRHDPYDFAFAESAINARFKDEVLADAFIVGAGPVGLFQVFELGLLGLNAHVIDSMPQVDDQCVELYPDKPIYDIPAAPVCSGRELIERLQVQIRPFAIAQFLFRRKEV